MSDANRKVHSLQLPDLSLVVMDPRQKSPAQSYLDSLSPSGRRTQRTALNNLAYIFSDGKISDCLHFPWQLLRYQHTSGLAIKLVEVGYARSSVNKHLVALRRVLEEAWRLGLYVDYNEYHRAADVKSLRTESVPSGRNLNLDELKALIASCLEDRSNPVLGLRDAAIIALMYASAIRRQEIVDLNLADLDLQDGRMRIAGKGSKQRVVFLEPGAVEAIRNWLEQRGYQAGPLFVRVTKSSKLVYRQLTPQAIYYMLKNRQIQADLEPFTPHDLRRTSITDLLSAHVDVLTVSNIAGHASADTTRRYDRRPEENKKRAAQSLKSLYPIGETLNEDPPDK
ncbi:MAG: tyrosine-type recombinase/integrase [Chloroflexota bacterium]